MTPGSAKLRGGGGNCYVAEFQQTRYESCFYIPTDSFSHSRNNKLIVWPITSHGVHFEAVVPSFVSVAWFEWETSLPQIGVSQINPPKQTSRYLIYLANLFLNQSMRRLFRWKQISPPLKLETLIATFWVPETTKRPRCIMVSDNGSSTHWWLSSRETFQDETGLKPFGIFI